MACRRRPGRNCCACLSAGLTEADWERIGAQHGPVARRLAGTFVGYSGPNCLATALAPAYPTVAAAEAVAGLWLHQEPFLRGLKALGFTGRPLVSGEALPPGAVLVWEDDNQVIQHACYALGDGLVLNKQAQSWWAPRQVLSAQTVLGSWQELRPFLYTQGHA